MVNTTLFNNDIKYTVVRKDNGVVLAFGLVGVENAMKKAAQLRHTINKRTGLWIDLGVFPQ